MKFHWDDIRVFLAIARKRSLPEAAQVLGLAHSTVFRRINAFEAELGVRLFDRASSGFSLTEAGESVLDLALDMEDRSERIARNIVGQDYALTGPIRVTTTHGLSLTLMGPVFKAFTDQHPEVTLDLQWGEQVRKLTKYESDVIIFPTQKPPENAFGRKLGRIAFQYFASPAYLKAKKRSDDLALSPDFADHHVIGLSENFSGQPFYEVFKRNTGKAKISLVCDSFLTVREAVASGAGIGLMPAFYGSGYKSLRALGDPIPGADNDVWILTHRDLKNTVRIRTFMDFAFTEIQKLKHGLAADG